LEEEIIDKDRVAETATKISAVKQVAGKAVDDAKLETDSKIDSKI
jgi:uncharacterized protein YjbJ (UPF0337 family)